MRVNNINEKKLNQTKKPQNWDGFHGASSTNGQFATSINDTNRQFVAVGYDKKNMKSKIS
jgi:hypothetical protein